MGKFMMPFHNKKITGEFNTRSAYRIRNGLGAHRGTDWAMPSRTPIPAMGDGTIKYVGYSKILGHVIVQTVWADGKVWYIGYCHLVGKPTLKVGDKISCGETIALVGNTGAASSGSHLHATLGTTLKSVFYGEHNKVIFDLKEFLIRQINDTLTDNVEVTYTRKNTNVVVEIKGAPSGSTVRIRKDGNSVYAKWPKKENQVYNKGITLTGKHELSVEVNDVVVSSETMAGGKASAPKKVAPVAQPATPTPPPVVKAAPIAPKAVPGKKPDYAVRPGDNLAAIASKNDIDLDELIKFNDISNPNMIRIGQVIRFPDKETPVKICECCKRPL